jgi:hypothetical protein
MAIPLSTATAASDGLDRYRTQALTWQSCGARIPAEL